MTQGGLQRGGWKRKKTQYDSQKVYDMTFEDYQTLPSCQPCHSPPPKSIQAKRRTRCGPRTCQLSGLSNKFAMTNPPISELRDSRTEKQRKGVLEVAHVRDRIEEYRSRPSDIPSRGKCMAARIRQLVNYCTISTVTRRVEPNFGKVLNRESTWVLGQVLFKTRFYPVRVVTTRTPFNSSMLRALLCQRAVPVWAG
ncbi:hypothetical protein K438DRAFT_1783179 [Mycena galopus ATCC 62051]|nr:hypothetical protein K438DRAFT_1783179 [Mycena galopus ATCC 62051]